MAEGKLETQRGGERKQKLLKIAAKLLTGEAEIYVIRKDRLPFYLEAALASGFKVEEIAGEGEKFPFSREEERLRTKDEESYSRESHLEVKEAKVPGKGRIAVVVERPEGSKEDFTPFWHSLRNLEQGGIQSSSETTAKS